MKVLSAEFEIEAQSWRDGQFSIPTEIIDLMGVSKADDLILEITSSKGTRIIRGKIKSGNEIYGNLFDHISSGELLRVRVIKYKEN